MLYLRARYYNPADGRFQSRDTWGGDVNHPMSMNRWTYVEGNPINSIDPSGYITEKESKRADFLVEKLNNVYNIQIEKDWGYLNDLFYVDPSIRTWTNCQWVDGDWQDIKELEWTFEAVKDMAKKFGTQGLFRTAMRWEPVKVYRVPTEYIFGSGAYSLNNVILPNNVFNQPSGSFWAKGQIVHELAHVWDTRQWPIFRLSNEMMIVTKSFKKVCINGPRGAQSCHLVYDLTGQNEAPPTTYATGYPREDWAESFATFMYPSWGTLRQIRKGYIERVIKNLKAP